MSEATDQQEEAINPDEQYKAVNIGAKSAMDEAKMWLNFSSDAEDLITFSLMDVISTDPGAEVSDEVKKRIESERLNFIQKNLKDNPNLLKIQSLTDQLAGKINDLFSHEHTPETIKKNRVPLRDIDVLSEQLEINLGTLPRPLIASEQS